MERSAFIATLDTMLISSPDQKKQKSPVKPLKDFDNLAADNLKPLKSAMASKNEAAAANSFRSIESFTSDAVKTQTSQKVQPQVSFGEGSKPANKRPALTSFDTIVEIDKKEANVKNFAAITQPKKPLEKQNTMSKLNINVGLADKTSDQAKQPDNSSGGKAPANVPGFATNLF